MNEDIPIITSPSIKQKKLPLINKMNRELRKIIENLKDENGTVDKKSLDKEVKKMLEKYKNKYSIEFSNSSLFSSSVSLGDSKLDNNELHIAISTYENRDLDFIFPHVEFRGKEK